MKFNAVLSEGVLLKRPFRFLAEISLSTSISPMTKIIFCPTLNPLMCCDILGSRLWYSTANPFSPNHILDTWEISEVDGGHLVCVNPERGRTAVIESLNKGKISELFGFYFFKNQYQSDNLQGNPLQVLVNNQGKQAFLSTQMVTFGDPSGQGFFPETRALSTRGLQELIHIRQSGFRAILLLCVQHNGIQSVHPGIDINPEYSHLLAEAQEKGVEILAYRLSVSLSEMHLSERLPFVVNYSPQQSFTLEG